MTPPDHAMDPAVSPDLCYSISNCPISSISLVSIFSCLSVSTSTALVHTLPLFHGIPRVLPLGSRLPIEPPSAHRRPKPRVRTTAPSPPQPGRPFGASSPVSPPPRHPRQGPTFLTASSVAAPGCRLDTAVRVTLHIRSSYASLTFVPHLGRGHHVGPQSCCPHLLPTVTVTTAQY